MRFIRYSAMILILLLVFALFLQAAIAATKSDTARYKRHSATGLNYYNKKDYENAIQEFTKASDIYPLDPSVHYYIGLSAFKKNDFKKAEEELSKVIVMSSSQSSFYKNAIKCFSDYKKEFKGVRPYSCVGGDGKFFRWKNAQFPLKIYISHGLTLPSGYRGAELTAEKRSQLSAWLKDSSYVAKIRRDRHYDDSFWKGARTGIAEWSFAKTNKLVDFKLVEKPNDANILVFWCSSLPGNGSATTMLPASAKDRAIVQISVEHILAKQAHLRADTVRYIAAHEFGHCLGLANSSFNRDIMFPIEETGRHKTTGFSPGGTNRVSHNDSTTLTALYNLPAPNLK